MPLTEWPEEIIGTTGAIREEYLDTTRAADKGDLAPLINTHLHFAAGS